MKKSGWLQLVGVSLLVLASLSSAFGRGGGGGFGGGGGGRGGGGGFGGGGGGGGARPSFGGGGGGGARPNLGGGAGGGGGAAARPNISKPTATTRPGGSSGSRPGGGLGGNNGGAGGGGGGARPSFPNQPGGGNLGLGERPNTGMKPNQPGLWNKPGGGNNLPNGGNKLPGGNGNNIANRPGGIGNGNNISNRPGGIGNGNNISNRPGGIGNNNNVNINNNHNNYWNNAGGYGHYHGDWYHGCWHGNWYNRPAVWWGAGFIGGAVVASTMPYTWGYSTYSNPYYVESAPAGGTPVDYSQPITMAAAPVAETPADPSAPATQTPEEQASEMLGEARTAFYNGEYFTAIKHVDEAIQKTPSDPVLHEFRGLVLFATKKYDQAAPTIYAVMSAGPGWDWTTMISLYPNVGIYTQQLRTLEQYRKAHPDSAQARFLLAYHYLTAGHSDAALVEFQEVVRLQPADQLSAQMVKTLSPAAEGDAAPAPAETAVASTPIEAGALVGSWTATQTDGTAVALTVTADNKFTWKFTQNKKPQEISGTSTLADNLLILRPTEGPPLVGQVALLADNKLNFRLDANNPGDTGLTFVR